MMRRELGAAARRRAAGVPARRAVPERPLQEGRPLRRAADSATPTTPTRSPAGPYYKPPGARRRHDRRALAARRARWTWPPRAHAIPRGAADLPDRVRRAEQAQQLPRRVRSPSRPNSTRSPSTSPGRTRAWRPSRSTCSRTTRSAGAPGSSVNGGAVGFQTGLEYVSGTPKPLYYGWPIPLTVTSAATASRCGASCARRRAHEGDGARAPQGSHSSDAADRRDQRAGLLEPSARRTPGPLARALDKPERRASTKARRSTPTAVAVSGRRSASACALR